MRSHGHAVQPCGASCPNFGRNRATRRLRAEGRRSNGLGVVCVGDDWVKRQARLRSHRVNRGVPEIRVPGCDAGVTGWRRVRMTPHGYLNATIKYVENGVSKKGVQSISLA